MKTPRRGRGRPRADAAPVFRLDGPNHLRVGRRRLVHFTGCDYLRLSRHPDVVAAFRQAAEAEGLGPAAARTTTGNHPLYGRLENAMARFAGAEAALLVGAGYLANLAVAQALAGKVDAVFIDEEAHPSLRDAAALLGAPMTTFRHCDPGDLRTVLGRLARVRHPLVLTDGVFPLSGRNAGLREHLGAMPAEGLLLVDDAHGLGVMGRRGRGTPDACGVGADPRLLLTATLSKALGTFGGVILGPSWLTTRVRSASRLFRASTPFPLPCAAATLESIRVLRREPDRLARLRRNVRQAKTALAAMGHPQPANDAPVLSICLAGERTARRLENGLARAGLFARAIAYPGDDARPRFRVALSSEHTPEQIERLVAVVRRIVR